jgi:hypothetical protein
VLPSGQGGYLGVDWALFTMHLMVKSAQPLKFAPSRPKTQAFWAARSRR